MTTDIPSLACFGTAKHTYCSCGRAVKVILRISFMAAKQSSSRATKKCRNMVFRGCRKEDLNTSTALHTMHMRG